MRFVELALVLTATAASAYAAPLAPFTIAPGSTWFGMMDIAPDDYPPNPFPLDSINKYETPILSIADPFAPVLIQCSDCGSLASFAANGIPAPWTDYLAYYADRPARYHISLNNFGIKPETVTVLDDDILIANPEPSTWLLMAGGFAALLIIGRSRAKLAARQ